MITDLSLQEITRRVANRSLSAEELSKAYLARIDQREFEVHAWVYMNAELVIEQARKIDAKQLFDGAPLAGIPLGVKDVFDTFDMPSSYGSPIYTNHRPAFDAAVVAQARALGAIIVGKTVTTEFATFKPGKTVNPRSPNPSTPHTPGGSSSGSAAAVAAGMVPAAFGTQTAASVIRPAAYCGIVGYKPTFGTLATAGAKALSPSLDTVGVFTRDVDDASFLVGELSKQRFELKPDAISRVGVCRTPHWHMTEESTKAVMHEAESAFRADGAVVSNAELPAVCERLVDVQTGIMFYEAAAAYAPELNSSPDGLSEPFRQILAKGSLIDGAMFAEFHRLTVRARNEVDALFETVDVIIAPSASGEAPAGLDSTGDPIFGRIWNLLGYPCVHIPVGVGPRGLPVGVTVVGARWQDARVLSSAKRLYLLVRDHAK